MKDSKHLFYFFAGAVAAGVIQYLVAKSIDTAKEKALLKSKVSPITKLEMGEISLWCWGEWNRNPRKRK